MAVIRVNKTKDFTVMSNIHLRDKTLSLKGKGLLSVMLSLPDNWDYSINGLSAICMEGTKAIRTILNELESLGYLIRTRTQDEKGRFDYIYDIFETPQPQDLAPHTLQGHTVKGYALDGIQYNTNKSNTDKSNTNKSSTDSGYMCIEEPLEPEKIELGKHKNVLISNEEIQALIDEFGEDLTNEAIEFLSSYIKMKGYQVDSHYGAICHWVIGAVKTAKNNAQKANARKAPTIDTTGKNEIIANVYLTNEEWESLCNEYSFEQADEAITFLSEYLTNNPNKQYSSHYQAIIDWVFTAIKERQLKQEELEIKEAELEQRKERIARIDERFENHTSVVDLTQKDYVDDTTTTMPFYNWLENN